MTNPNALAGMEVYATELSPEQFERISRRVYEVCGIELPPGKEGLVKSRLVKRLRRLGLDGFEKYLALVEGDRTGRELAEMVDLLTTNKTSFFRESEHFDFLRSEVFPRLKAGRPLRVWSAGCSFGKEPYTIAMLMREDVPDLDRRDARVLATDISARALAVARAGLYEAEIEAEIPAPLLKKHFARVGQSPAPAYRVNDDVRRLVSFARLNLMDEWPMKGPFDAIFCRNVMIYFDKETQTRLANRFHSLLAPGGHLFVGHSESLSKTATPFRYVQPALYVK
jgi:chemotaxis protein methyltransferase CheR